MKLGGITWWRNNYGSILQAYALQEWLNSKDNIEYEIINQFGKSITSADNVLDKLKTIGILKTLQRAFWKYGMPGLRKRSTKMQLFVDTYLRISNAQYSEKTIAKANDEYDGFICGSDQIWNPKLVDLDSMYWLGFSSREKKRIAYAPSIGVDFVEKDEAIRIKNNLTTFDAISCREDSGTQLINSILNEKRCKTVLDPTLLVDRTLWDELSKKKVVEKEYVFSYMLRGSKKQRQLIEDFARAENLEIVTIPFLETEYTEWYDLKFGDIKYWDAAPDEFVSLIRNAKYVFTDSFHSMVFSILYHIPFFNFPKAGQAQMNRITGLQELLGIKYRVVDSWEDIEKVKGQELEWQSIDLKFEKNRQESRNYMQNAIKP